MVCDRKTIQISASHSMTLRDWIAHITQKLSLKNPSIDSSVGTLFMPANKNTHFKLEMTLKQLKDGGHISGAELEEFEIVDPVLPGVLIVQIHYDGDESM
jgi:hypothetical protein